MTVQWVAEMDAAHDELSALSSYVGCGLGDESTTLLEYIARVRDGIDSQGRVLVSVISDLTSARARIAELEESLRVWKAPLILLQDSKETLARIAELEAAQQWRPMSEAPKSCRLLLAFADGKVGQPIPNCGDYDTEVTWTTVAWGTGHAPIAWLPLPEPPKETT